MRFVDIVLLLANEQESWTKGDEKGMMIIIIIAEEEVHEIRKIKEKTQHTIRQ